MRVLVALVGARHAGAGGVRATGNSPVVRLGTIEERVTFSCSLTRSACVDVISMLVETQRNAAAAGFRLDESGNGCSWSAIRWRRERGFRSSRTSDACARDEGLRGPLCRVAATHVANNEAPGTRSPQPDRPKPPPRTSGGLLANTWSPSARRTNSSGLWRSLTRRRARTTPGFAAANTTPIANITSAIKKLKFSTGQGIAAKHGALGMSLQAPRIVTDDDVALLRGLARGRRGR